MLSCPKCISGAPADPRPGRDWPENPFILPQSPGFLSPSAQTSTPLDGIASGKIIAVIRELPDTFTLQRRAAPAFCIGASGSGPPRTATASHVPAAFRHRNAPLSPLDGDIPRSHRQHVGARALSDSRRI